MTHDEMLSLPVACLPYVAGTTPCIAIRVKGVGITGHCELLSDIDKALDAFPGWLANLRHYSSHRSVWIQVRPAPRTKLSLEQVANVLRPLVEAQRPIAEYL